MDDPLRTGTTRRTRINSNQEHEYQYLAPMRSASFRSKNSRSGSFDQPQPYFGRCNSDTHGRTPETGRPHTPETGRTRSETGLSTTSIAGGGTTRRQRGRTRVFTTADTQFVITGGKDRGESSMSMNQIPSMRTGPTKIRGYSEEIDIGKEIKDAIDARCNAFHRHRKPTIELTDEMTKEAANTNGQVSVEDLHRVGFVNEDLCRVIYGSRDVQVHKALLCPLRLATGGGLDRIEDIWYDEKYRWFLYLLISVVFNVASLLVMDWNIFQTFLTPVEERLKSLGHSGQQPTAILEALLNVTVTLSHADSEGVKTAVSQNLMNKQVIAHIHDVGTQQMFLQMAAVVAVWEIGWIFCMLIYSLSLWFTFLTDSSEFRSYKALRTFFQLVLPQFSTFSALKLMTRVHPALLYNNYYDNMNSSSWKSSRLGRYLEGVLFLVWALLCAVAALCAFAVKILAVGFGLLDTEMFCLFRFGGLLSLMVQCMGAIMMEQVLQDRLAMFVFGGRDTAYELNEYAHKSVYESLLTKQIWTTFWPKDKAKTIVLLATFDHYDLQKLLILDEEEEFDLNAFLAQKWEEEQRMKDVENQEEDEELGVGSHNGQPPINSLHSGGLSIDEPDRYDTEVHQEVGDDGKTAVPNIGPTAPSSSGLPFSNGDHCPQRPLMPIPESRRSYEDMGEIMRDESSLMSHSSSQLLPSPRTQPPVVQMQSVEVQTESEPPDPQPREMPDCEAEMADRSRRADSESPAGMQHEMFDIEAASDSRAGQLLSEDSNWTEEPTASTPMLQGVEGMEPVVMHELSNKSSVRSFEREWSEGSGASTGMRAVTRALRQVGFSGFDDGWAAGE